MLNDDKLNGLAPNGPALNGLHQTDQHPRTRRYMRSVNHRDRETGRPHPTLEHLKIAEASFTLRSAVHLNSGKEKTLPLRTTLMLMLGLTLSSETVARETGLVFVSNERTNNITVIDPRQEDRVVKWIHTSHRPRGMSFLRDRTQLLVACGDDDVIDVIDVATLAVIDHIPTGASPEMFEPSLDQKTLFVPNRAKSVVEVINIAEKIIEREIPTGAEPLGIAIGGNGQTLFVTSGISDWVSIIDLKANAVTDNIAVGTRPGRFLLVRGGRELWVSNELAGQVSIIDRATNKVMEILSSSCRERARQM